MHGRDAVTMLASFLQARDVMCVAQRVPHVTT
jgi:hypothetical protein